MPVQVLAPGTWHMGIYALTHVACRCRSSTWLTGQPSAGRSKDGAGTPLMSSAPLQAHSHTARHTSQHALSSVQGPGAGARLALEHKTGMRVCELRHAVSTSTAGAAAVAPQRCKLEFA